MDTKHVVISNCNSIDQATIKIKPKFLNIKFGINGTGKSTIARAIKCALNPALLSELRQFRNIENPKIGGPPTIAGAETLKNVLVFNEDYIRQFAFQQDEVLKNSFDIFVKTPDYDKKTAEIDALISGMKTIFTNDSGVEQVIQDLAELSNGFGTAKSGYSAAGPIGKALGKGNKIENIPMGLEGYKDFLKSESPSKWIPWQTSGVEFMELSADCPFCTRPIADKKEQILKVSQEYNAKSIEHLQKIMAVVERLSQYFSEEARAQIKAITGSKEILPAEAIEYLKQLKSQIDTLKDKLQSVKNATYFTFEGVDNVNDKINLLKIEINFLPLLNSAATVDIANSINASLTEIADKAGLLQGEVNKHKKSIKETIDKHKNEINIFLLYAGYKYRIDIEESAAQYRMKLKHCDHSASVKGGDQHLSFGEKNAFSMVLFMYECLSKEPDLIVLDDPISSFDKNKKFAILDMLFRGKNSLSGRTVLLLTHDLEPVIDMVKNLPHIFNGVPKASFLRLQDGQINEIEILKNDILTFSQVCDENVCGHPDDVVRAIYLRRYYETLDDKGDEYNLISNLLHSKSPPTYFDGTLMSKEAIDCAAKNIIEKIPGFDFDKILTRISDAGEMIEAYKAAKSGYEKLQIFRMIKGDYSNDVVMKYINETFHIENEYVSQLNPTKYEMIPGFIVELCDAHVATLT